MATNHLLARQYRQFVVYGMAAEAADISLFHIGGVNGDVRKLMY